MNCSDIQSRLTQYIDDDLPNGERLRVESHLAQCYACKEELDELESFLEVCRGALRHPSPVNRFEELRKQLPFVEPQHPQVVYQPGLGVWEVLWKFAAAAAVLLIVCIPVFYMKNGTEVSSQSAGSSLLQNHADSGQLSIIRWVHNVERAIDGKEINGRS